MGETGSQGRIESALERYRAYLSPVELERLAQAIDRPLPPALRVNTLKTTLAQARRCWPAWYGWEIEPVPYCPTGWQVEGGTPLAQTVEHRMGFYYIQDAASMLPVELFDLAGADAPLVLDMAAAPGGKTTHWVCRLADPQPAAGEGQDQGQGQGRGRGIERGLVIANDSSGARIAALRANLQRWGAMNVVVTQYPGERLGRWFPERFDYVLLDAPCSGAGLRVAERRKSRPLSERRRQALHRLQVQLLDSAFQALKPGGQVVYATCSLDPLENEAVVDALLARYPEQVTVETLDHVLSVPAPALPACEGQTFRPPVGRLARLWPHLYDTVGFCVALIRKRASVPVERETPPRRALAKAGFERLDRPAVREILTALRGTFGFDLGTVLEAQALVLYAREASVYAVPERFLSEWPDWPCVALGMLVGLREPEGFVPSHELVARFAAAFTTQRMSLTEEQAAVWLDGRDLRGVQAGPFSPGATVLMQDPRGRFIGRGEVQRRRIKNLLPRRVVY